MPQHIIQVPPVRQEWLYVPDVPYETVDGITRCLQLLIPYRRAWPRGLRVPVVALVPGSAWYRQEMYNGLLNWGCLARRGYAVAAIQYRDSSMAKFPAQIEDARAALRFLPSLADPYHLDMGNVFLMGDSSGAHTALMTALTAGAGDPSLRGVISYYAPTNLTRMQEEGPIRDLLATPEDAREASCGAHVFTGRPLPPVLMLHGDADDDVDVSNSRELYRILSDHGKEVDYYEVIGERHGGGTWWSEPILDIVESFLRRNLKESSL